MKPNVQRFFRLGFFLLFGFFAFSVTAQVITRSSAQPHPVKLKEARFYLKAFANEVRDGRFDPFDHPDRRPLSLFFPAPGKLEIDWGDRIISCNIRSSGLTVRMTFEATCETGAKFANWNWVGENVAQTNLLFALSGPPHSQNEELLRYDASYDDLSAKYDEDFASRIFPKLSGIFIDADESVLYITPQGQAYLNEEPRPSRLRECALLKPGRDVDEAVRSACLTIETATGPLTLGFSTNRDMLRLKEAMPREDVTPAGRGFQIVKSGRRFKAVR